MNWLLHDKGGEPPTTAVCLPCPWCGQTQGFRFPADNTCQNCRGACYIGFDQEPKKTAEPPAKAQPKPPPEPKPAVAPLPPPDRFAYPCSRCGREIMRRQEEADPSGLLCSKCARRDAEVAEAPPQGGAPAARDPRTGRFLSKPDAVLRRRCRTCGRHRAADLFWPGGECDRCHLKAEHARGEQTCRECGDTKPLRAFEPRRRVCRACRDRLSERAMEGKPPAYQRAVRRRKAGRRRSRRRREKRKSPDA